ncbi:hypothetical protein [Streptomyces sp. NPDC088794]|uniref:hypothetical protein n=1 Tax=Streptomyces sp. NPDC088794 TaxID=3365902 RepID=UPI0038115D49
MGAPVELAWGSVVQCVVCGLPEFGVDLAGLPAELGDCGVVDRPVGGCGVPEGDGQLARLLDRVQQQPVGGGGVQPVDGGQVRRRAASSMTS